MRMTGKKDPYNPQDSPFLSKDINKSRILHKEPSLLPTMMWKIPHTQDISDIPEWIQQCPTLTSPFPDSPAFILISRSSNSAVIANNLLPFLNLVLSHSQKHTPKPSLMEI